MALIIATCYSLLATYLILSVIPQEPTLFRGYLRYNLAPDRADEPEMSGDGAAEAATLHSSLTDAEAWGVLKRTGLEAKVRIMLA